jgi:hypothetical protein
MQYNLWSVSSVVKNKAIDPHYFHGYDLAFLLHIFRLCFKMRRDIRSPPYAAYLDGGVYWRNVYSKDQLLRVILDVIQEQNHTELTCCSTRIKIQNIQALKYSCGLVMNLLLLYKVLFIRSIQAEPEYIDTA